MRSRLRGGTGGGHDISCPNLGRGWRWRPECAIRGSDWWMLCAATECAVLERRLLPSTTVGWWQRLVAARAVERNCQITSFTSAYRPCVLSRPAASDDHRCGIAGGVCGASSSDGCVLGARDARLRRPALGGDPAAGGRRAGAAARDYYRAVDAPGGLPAISADASFHAASTMKIPVMIQVFAMRRRGGLRSDAFMRAQSVREHRRWLAVRARSERRFRQWHVRPRGAHDDRARPHASDDPALEQPGDQHRDRTRGRCACRLDGACTSVPPTSVCCAASRTAKHSTGGSTTPSTARDLGALLLAIQQDRAATPAGCAAMRDVLLGQELNAEIPAGLPRGTKVAHKTGQITGVLHDAAWSIRRMPRRMCWWC